MSRPKAFYLDTEILNCVDCHHLDPAELGRQFYAAVKYREKNLVSEHIRFEISRPSIPGWAAIRAMVFDRDNHTCQYCGAIEGPMQCDHVIPFSRGGTSDPENLVTACRSCNCRKKDKTPEEWIAGGR